MTVSLLALFSWPRIVKNSCQVKLQHFL